MIKDNTDSVVSASNRNAERDKQSVSSENTYYGFGDTAAVQYPQTAILVKDLANLVLSEKAVSEKFKAQYEVQYVVLLHLFLLLCNV